MFDPTKKRLRSLLIAGAVLIAYLLLRRFTPFYIPCLFHTVTGLKCPGCGGTRMAVALMRLDFATAYKANPFLLFTLPLLAFEVIYQVFSSHKKTAFDRVNNVILIIYCAALIIFGVLRNLYELGII